MDVAVGYLMKRKWIISILWSFKSLDSHYFHRCLMEKLMLSEHVNGIFKSTSLNYH